MTTCEDAPCCGCCGTSLYGSEVASESFYDSDDYYDSFHNDYEPEVDPEDCEHESTQTSDGIAWECSYCETPVPAPEGDFVWV